MMPLVQPLLSCQRPDDKRFDGAFPLPENILADVLAFCDASDYVSILRASESIFVKPLRFHLCSTDSLCLSFLLKMYPNRLAENHGQQLAVRLLIQSLLGWTPKRKLKHLELSNLRGITGDNWFPILTRTPLVSLDLTNCARLNRENLLNYLGSCPRTLRHLHLSGCRCVDPETLCCIQNRHRQLLSLSLGSCSQRIRTPHIFSLLEALRSLKHLDLKCLNHLEDKVSPDSDTSFLDILPESIESINLTGTRPLRLLCRERFQSMNTYLNRSLEYMQAVQGQVQNLNESLHVLNNAGANANDLLGRNSQILDFDPNVYIWKDEPSFRLKMKHLVLDGCGNPRSGIFRGSLATFSLGRCLREVHLAGCEGINEWEVSALAVNCGETLTCFQMRAGTIGNESLLSLAKHCRVLGEVDVSACFGVGDEGIIALCENLKSKSEKDSLKAFTDEKKDEYEQLPKRRKLTRSSLKILRAASLPRLTSRAVQAMARLESLTILDIHDCPRVEPSIVHETVRKLPFLVEINGKDIKQEVPTLSALLHRDSLVPRTLKIVNQRTFHHYLESIESHQTETLRNCCAVRNHSQRLTSAVPLAPVYHCVDCNLLPELDRGFCISCKEKCHSGHKTFLGSYTRFSCDCPFGINSDNVCRAIGH